MCVSPYMRSQTLCSSLPSLPRYPKLYHPFFIKTSQCQQLLHCAIYYSCSADNLLWAWCFARRECVSDVVECCSLARAPAAVDAALQCVIQMAASSALQVLPFSPGSCFMPSAVLYMKVLYWPLCPMLQCTDVSGNKCSIFTHRAGMSQSHHGAHNTLGEMCVLCFACACA